MVSTAINSQTFFFSASFTISNDTDVVITAVASDRENRYLFTADSRGCVFVWDIREYALFQRFSRVVKNVCHSFLLVLSVIFCVCVIKYLFSSIC